MTTIFTISESYFEVGLVNKLETVIEKQRNQIKKLDRSVLDYQTENDELSCQNEKLSACTRDLRRKLRSTQTQLHSMVDERADLTAKVSHTYHLASLKPRDPWECTYASFLFLVLTKKSNDLSRSGNGRSSAPCSLLVDLSIKK